MALAAVDIAHQEQHDVADTVRKEQIEVDDPSRLS